MTLTTTTHLNFRGDARDALEFYASVFDGVLAITTYGDFGMPADAPDATRVVFGVVESPDGFRMMAYDIPGQTGRAESSNGSTTRENGVTLTDERFFVSLAAGTLDDLQARWAALAVGATIIEPLTASAWSPGFGMLTDRFGVTWSVSVAPSPSSE